jgi:hypothetical protein
MNTVTHMDDDDATLVRRSLGGENAAFETLLLRYLPSVTALCRRVLSGRHEAQDVVQESALQAYLGLRRLAKPERFAAWFHAIAANQARMVLRRARPLSLDLASDAGLVRVLWPQPLPSPADVAEARELHDAIIGALGELTPARRDVAIRYFLEGYSYAELALLLGVPISTIKGRLFKSRTQLRRRLAPHAPADAGERPVARKELPMTEEAMVSVAVESIRSAVLTQHSVVVLRASALGRNLPIWIGSAEAEAIARALEGRATERPMTHDLTLQLLDPLGVQVERVVISKIVGNTFYAEIRLQNGAQTHVVDARPSDAIALAVRAGVPMFADRAVLDLAGYDPSDLDLLPAAEHTSRATTPFFDATWRYLADIARLAKQDTGFELLSGELDWDATFPTRSVEVDGDELVGMRLAHDADAGWLLVRQPLHDQIREVARRGLEQALTVRTYLGMT